MLLQTTVRVSLSLIVACGLSTAPASQGASFPASSPDCGVRSISHWAADLVSDGRASHVSVVQRPSVEEVYIPNADSTDWILGQYKGRNRGGYIEVWPEAWTDSSIEDAPTTGDKLVRPSDIRNCTPKALARAARIFAHEYLHQLCPGHESRGDSESEDRPSPPRCNDLNYAMNVGATLCAMIHKIGECGSASPPCPPLYDEDGEEIPGTDTPEKIAELCEALTAEHTKLQERWNNETNAAVAHECLCPSGGWRADEDDYPDCPPMPFDPDDCGGSAAETFPDNKVVPDCGQGCS